MDSGDDAAPPSPTPPPATPPAPIAPSQVSPDQDAEINRRITNAQGQQSTILGGSSVNVAQGVQQKQLLGG